MMCIYIYVLCVIVSIYIEHAPVEEQNVNVISQSVQHIYIYIYACVLDLLL